MTLIRKHNCFSSATVRMARWPKVKQKIHLFFPCCALVLFSGCAITDPFVAITDPFVEESDWNEIGVNNDWEEDTRQKCIEQHDFKKCLEQAQKLLKVYDLKRKSISDVGARLRNFAIGVGLVGVYFGTVNESIRAFKGTGVAGSSIYAFAESTPRDEYMKAYKKWQADLSSALSKAYKAIRVEESKKNLMEEEEKIDCEIKRHYGHVDYNVFKILYKEKFAGLVKKKSNLETMAKGLEEIEEKASSRKKSRKDEEYDIHQKVSIWLGHKLRDNWRGVRGELTENRALIKPESPAKIAEKIRADAQVSGDFSQQERPESADVGSAKTIPATQHAQR